MNNRSRLSKVAKPNAHRQLYIYRPLVLSALLVGGFLQFVAPVLANGALSGTSIRNTATATYDDPTTGTTIQTTSNTVTVTVAEVAGITVTPSAVINSTTPGGQILPGNNLFYEFKVTNVGNGATRFYIPNGGQISITGAGTLTTGAQLQVSYDGGTSFVSLSTLTNQITAPVSPSASIIVRVPITVNANAPSGAAIAVRLGNTGPNDNSAATQNQPDNADGSNVNEVRTVDADPAQAPVAPGEKEASAVQQILVGAQPQAFAAILKSRTNYAPGSPTSLTDDILTYGLSLRVDANAPAGSPGFVAANLTGTNINLQGSGTVPRILVADAIPAGTVLTGTPTAPSAPAGWVVVYSTNDPAVTNLPPNDLNVVWTTARPASDATIKRIGFIYNGTITAGTTVTGFSFQVQTATVPAAGQSIENIAQVLGESVGAPGKLVYDESGDQNPSNFNDNGTEGSNVPTNGVANSATQGVDPFSSDNDLTNDNQGIGPGGEVNVFVLLPPGAVLNGPQNQPGASGPTGTNDDFTNQALPGNVTPVRGATLTTAQTITFTNTVQNPGTTALTNILLVPRDIAQVAGINNNQLPNGTTVQIVYGTTNATYTYNATTGVFSFTGGTGTTAVRINNLPAGQSVDYTVRVTLPVGTALSTDERTAGVLNGGYPVPVVAFSDTGTVNGLPDAGESQNLTINRTYLGYLRLTKDVRILNAAGGVVQEFTTTPTAANIVPGNVLEYRISYQNISEASVGSGNVTLSANQVTITENGTIGGLTGNNWALDNDNADADNNTATGIDTSNLQGTAAATQGTIVFNPGGDRSGPDQATDVTIYINNTGVVAPASTGTFTFRRRIN